MPEHQLIEQKESRQDEYLKWFCGYANAYDGTVDTIAVENEFADNMYQRSELDWLIYNKPLEYAQLVLGEGLEAYVKGEPEHRLMD